MKTRSVIGSTLVLALAFVLTALVGCDNFMSSDDDFKKKLKDEVKVANAPKIQLRVQSESGTGTVSPNGLTTVKVEVPFDLLFQPSNDYGFTRWEAFSTENTAEPLSGVVSFENPESTETKATLLVTRNDILIRPICVERPRVSGTNPTSGRVDVVRNYPAKIYFSQEMDPASFEFDDGSKRRDGKFKNIEISGLFGDPDTAEYEPYEQYFNEPELNVSRTGKTLTIQPMDGNLPRSYSVIRITIKKDVTDVNGLGMAQDVSFEYTLNNQQDKSPPVIDTDELKGGRTNAFEFPSDVSTHRTKNEPVWLSVSASDAATGGGNVISISVSHRRIYDSSGTAQSTTTPENTVVYGFSPSEDNLNVMEFQHDLGAVPDGVYELLIQATDSNQNITKLENAVKYIIVRDTTPPAEQPDKITHSGDTASGWFNNAANKTITFTPDQSIVDQGVDASGERPRTRSSTVQWQFRIGSANPVTTYWASAANALPADVAAQIEDGDAIPVQVRFRDDLGNTSAYFDYNTIKKDSVAPSGNLLIKDTTEINGVKMIGDHNANVEVNATDATSGRYQFIVKPENTAPELTDSWTNFPEDPTKKIDASVTFDVDDGEKTAHLWVRDKADNISPVVTESAILDSKDPQIQSVYVQDEAWSDMSDEPDNSPGDQYSNAGDRYANFFVKAFDEGAGVSHFRYSTDDGENYSSFFEATTNSSVQGSGDYLVRNVHVARPGGGIVLIFGKVLVPDVQDSIPFTFQVQDAVGRESVGIQNDSDTNDFIYDTEPPVVDSVSVTDQGGWYDDGSTFYVNDTNQTLSITARDSQTGTEAVSGIKEAVFIQNGLSGAPPTVVFSSSPESVGPLLETQEVTLSSTEGLKTLEFTLYDHAGNIGPGEVPVYLDTTEPEFVMNFKNGETSFATKEADSDSESLDAHPDYSTLSTFTLELSGATDGSGSGVAAGEVHTLNVYKKVDSETKTPITGYPLSIAPDYSDTISIGPESAVYTAEVLLHDNVDNVRSGQLGFHFDATPPVITDPGSLTTFTVHNASGIAEVYNSRIYVPATTVQLSLEASDTPASDPGGSGLSSVVTRMWTASEGTESDETAPLVEEETPKYLKLDDETSIWNLPVNEVTRFTAGVTDKAGNIAWSHGDDPELSDFIIVADTVSPTVTPILILPDPSDPEYFMDEEEGTLYVASASLTVSALDGDGSSDTNSGVTGWALSSEDTPPTSFENYASPVDATAELEALITNTASSVYVFAQDRVENVSDPVGLEGGKKLYLDDTIPVIDNVAINRKDDIDQNPNTYTTKVDVLVPLNVSDVGAGIESIEFGGTGLDSVTDPEIPDTTWNATENILTFDPPVPSINNYEFEVELTEGDTSKEITVAVTDAVDNVVTDAAEIELDTQDPVVSGSLSALSPGNGGWYVKDDVTADFSVDGGTTDADCWIISTNEEETPATLFEDGSDSFDTNETENIPVGTKFDKNDERQLYVHVCDHAGNVGTVLLTENPVTLDDENPGITVEPLSAESPSRDITLELNIIEDFSGITAIEITGVESTSLSTEWSESLSGDTLTLTKIDNTTALRTTQELTPYELPVTLTAENGLKKVTVKLFDAVGNTSDVSNEVETILDSERPEVSAMWLKRTDDVGTQVSGHDSDPYTTDADEIEIKIEFTEEGQGIETIDFTGSTGLADFEEDNLVIKVDGATYDQFSVSGTTITFDDDIDARPKGENAELIINGISLSSEDGEKTIKLADVTDPAGSTESVIDSQTITLDTQAPTLTGTLTLSPLAENTDDTPSTWWVSESVEATGIEASDPTSGVSMYAFIETTSSSAPTAPERDAFTGEYPETTPFSVDVSTRFNTENARYLYVYFMDEAGNISEGYQVYSDPVRIDNTDPTGLAIGDLPSSVYYHPVKEVYYFTGTDIEFSPDATDDDSGILGYSTQSDGKQRDRNHHPDIK